MSLDPSVRYNFCLFIYLFTDFIQFYLLYTAVIFFFFSFFFFKNVKQKNTIKYKKKQNKKTMGVSIVSPTAP